MQGGMEAAHGRLRALAATLAGVVLLAACAQAEPDASATSADASKSTQPSTPASAGSSATNDSSERALQVDDWAEVVVDGLRLRREAGTEAMSWGFLPNGAQGFVVAGPIEMDGHAWFALAAPGLPYSEREPCSNPTIDPDVTLSCPVWFGWVAAADTDGEPWVVPTEPSCPERPETLTEFLDIPLMLEVACFGGETFTFDAFLSPGKGPGRGCGPVPFTVGPEFLGPCAIHFLQAEETPTVAMGPELGAHLSPELGECDYGGYSPPETCPFVPYIGQWITVEGLLDHPEATSCEAVEVRAGEFYDPAWILYRCRSAFVITSIAPRDE